MTERTIVLNGSERGLLIYGLILAGDEYAEDLEKARNDPDKTPLFKSDTEGRSWDELRHEMSLEKIRNLWEKIEPAANSEAQ